ncbi:uncharacterized membrane protein (DUF4010 family) [Rhodopseudomonas julia]|uniref:Uncharacterized membrane protein (DUF4010 family) n=1 Tax=Rhodopseudomonas julia TaxID=200617 RepID=A0ABU0C5Y7_9BRAD|nr:DUF4010 domain-containing protein [Rhodopseudomonas julia]MDQ0325938.1 uncharacterized membrane protein (DUF4010 family) [Rhodopseudomonas julia]
MTGNSVEIALLLRLAAALAIGLLIGLERGWETRRAEGRTRAAGLRTFALSGLLGGASAALALPLGGFVFAAAFLGYAGALISFSILQAQAEHRFSMTTVIAGLLAFCLGAMAVTGDERVAIAAAVAATLILALREPLHRWLAGLSWEEIRAVLVLCAMTFLLLPFLPNRTIDPWDAINPYEIWLLAILIAIISFGGYVAVRLFGSRLGILATGLAGGLASSTATTVTLSRMARKDPASARLFAAGILVSGMVMMLRVATVAIALAPALAAGLAPPLLCAAFGLALGALVLAGKRHRGVEARLDVGNPLALGTTLRLAGLLALIMLSVGLVLRRVGEAGVLAVAGLSGLADVDAVTISMARLSPGPLGAATATTAILVAVCSNTLSKAAIAVAIGGRGVGIPVAAASLLALAGLAATMAWLYLA